MKKIFLSLILLYVYQHLSAQCPVSGNFYATQQVEIDNFQTNYPNCVALTGSLHISLNDNITNLGQLGVLLSVEGDVWIQNLQFLPSLSGLDNITAIGGDLVIENADSLLSLSGLTSLQSVGGYVKIRDNSQLQTFGGLGALQTIGDYLEIDVNQELITLDGIYSLTALGANSTSDLLITNNPLLVDIGDLQGLTAVYGELNIYNNPSMFELTGLQTIGSVLGDVSIEYNDALPDLYGLGSLGLVGGRLDISDNMALNNISGLNGLSVVGEDLIIYNNPALTSLDGLQSLTSLPLDLTIAENPNITDLNGLNNLVSVGGDFLVDDNGFIVDISGFGSLTTVSGDFEIYGTEMLETFSGLQALETVGGDVSISSDRLHILDGLTALDSVGGLLNISGFDSLTDISALSSLINVNEINISTCGMLESLWGLQNVDPNSITGLSLINNPVLAFCEVPSICQYLQMGVGSYDFYNNAANCEDEVAVLAACNDQAVWPGDANDNNVADNFDVLYIGLHFGDTGPARDSVSNTWEAKQADNWNQWQVNGKNVKYADCNGDGTVNALDMEAITLNNDSVHLFMESEVRGGNPPLRMIPDQAVYLPGELVTLTIHAGDASTTVTDLYGLAFEIIYDNGMAEPGTVQLNFSNSFLGLAADNLTFGSIEEQNGTADVAISRTDHQHVSGYGEIATLQFTASTTIDSVLNGVSGFSIYEAVDSSGNQLFFDLYETTIVIDGESVFIEEPTGEFFFSVYPNPFDDQLVISAPELNGEAQLLIFDATGKEIYSSILTNANFTLSTADWGAGIYFYRLKSGATMAHGKLAKE